MHRIDGPTAAPGGLWTEGNPVGGVPATIVSDDWMNDVQENICKVIVDAGIALVKGDYTQLKAAIAATIAAAVIPDLLNSTRIDVASAATVNLTTAAPNTRHINITGSVGIAGFTVTAGKCYFVRFAGAPLLTNSASLVTQSGANITPAAGDTCILRATANNVVEVLCYAPGIRQEMGYGQTWQGLTALRALNTTYTNTTGRTIAISVTVQVSSSSGGSVGMTVNGLAITRGTQSYLGSAPTSAFVLVPPGATYTAYMNSGSGSISDWQELR